MTEGQRVRELEHSTVVPLEGRQPKIFWAIQVALWFIWLTEGVLSVRSGTANWLDWLKIAAVLLASTVFGVALIMRRIHGHPRLEFHDWGLLVRTHDLTKTIGIDWSEMDRVQMTTSQVTIHRQSGSMVRLPLQSYVIVRAVKAQLGRLAQERGVTVDGYW
jgi:hypothetical protein